MGGQFGDLPVKVRGIVQYTLSPFEQKAFGGAFKNGIPNMWRRFTGQVFRVVPPFILAYLWIDWGIKEHKRLLRKDPAEFANDV